MTRNCRLSKILIPGQTRLVESVQDLNFRLAIQAKVYSSNKIRKTHNEHLKI